MEKLPPKSINLIIADPPYFEVKGDFDFIWSSFEDYLKDVEKWAIACKRVLADNGSLFWYGHAKKIAYSQVILDKYFNLENNITVEFNRQTKKGVELFRCFAPVTERILFYSNEISRTGLEEIKLDINNFQSLRAYFRDFQKDLGLSLKQINLKLGHRKAEHAFYWNSTQWDMPTPETYAELLLLPSNSEFIRREYEELRREYEELRRPFNNFLKLYDVMKFDQEAHITKEYDHDTVKPETLTRALIMTCSRVGDTLLIPFAGSGTECAMAIREGRNFYASDLDLKHCNTTNKRVKKELELKKQGELF
jgi:site-specific DNA-methyltransferase (adenine-specific)